MKVASLGSGSSGNATLVDTGDGLIMIDCGFSLVETERRLGEIGKSVADIAAVLVTHEHSDHISGVATLARKCGLPVYMTHGTERKFSSEADFVSHRIQADQAFEVCGLRIHPVPVPHDAREPVQFVFQKGAIKLGVLTDLGSLTPRVVEAYQGCQTMLVEANHDLEMLMSGPYPAHLKKRVGGRWGHLNNIQTADFVRQINSGATLGCLVLGHISRKNNHPDRVGEAVEEAVRGIDQIHYASQDEPLAWVQAEQFPEQKSA